MYKHGHNYTQLHKQTFKTWQDYKFGEHSSKAYKTHHNSTNTTQLLQDFTELGKIVHHLYKYLQHSTALHTTLHNFVFKQST